MCMYTIIILYSEIYFAENLNNVLKRSEFYIINIRIKCTNFDLQILIKTTTKNSPHKTQSITYISPYMFRHKCAIITDHVKQRI